MALLKLKQITKPTGGSAGDLVVFNGTDIVWSNEYNGGVGIPSGTVADRPNSPVEGMIRFETDELSLVVFDGTDWKKVGSDSYRIVSEDGETWVDTQINPDKITFATGGESVIVIYPRDIDKTPIIAAESENADADLILKPKGEGSVLIDTDGVPTIEADVGSPFNLVGDSILLSPREGGKVSIMGEGDSIIETPENESLTIKVGNNTSTTDPVNLVISGSDSDVASALPGDIVLEVGKNTADDTTGQILATTDYTPVDDFALVTKIYVDSAIGTNETVTVITDNATVGEDDSIIISRPTINQPVSVTIPTGQLNGRRIIVKDGKGISEDFSLTISSVDLIDGQSNLVIQENYASVTIIFDGTTWNII